MYTMDAIKSVENEVDKVLRLFDACRETCNSKIDEVLQTIECMKQEFDSIDDPNQTELNSRQASIVQNIVELVQNSYLHVTNSHRELHVPVSKIGKTIDKNFIADFACVSDTSLFQMSDNNKLLNLAIVQHLLRHGFGNVAGELVKEANLPVDPKEMMRFDALGRILRALKKRDTGPALAWAVKNREQLREINSPLEFKIHRIRIIELHRQGISKQHEIIQYARENLQDLDPCYNLDIQQLLGGLVYLKIGIENSPYKYLLDPLSYSEIEDIFVSNACVLLDLSARSPLSMAIEAGCVALPSLLNMNQILSNQGVQNIWQNRDVLPIGIDLGRKLQFHSTFSCPILKQQSTESNPPMRLACGHVISRDALHKLSGSSNANKLKCPYCPMEQVVSDAKQIHF